MRRAFISEAVNFRKDAAGGDKQADDHFVFYLIIIPDKYKRVFTSDVDKIIYDRTKLQKLK